MQDWTLQQVRDVLEQARSTRAAGPRRAAERIEQHGLLMDALDWLLRKYHYDAMMTTLLTVHSTALVNATRLFPLTAEKDSPKSYAIKNRAQFDRAVRALLKFLDSLSRGELPPAS